MGKICYTIIGAAFGTAITAVVFMHKQGSPQYLLEKLNHKLSSDPARYEHITDRAMQDMYQRKLEALDEIGACTRKDCADPRNIAVVVSASGGNCLEIADLRSGKHYPVNSAGSMLRIGDEEDIYNAAVETAKQGPGTLADYSMKKAERSYNRAKRFVRKKLDEWFD